MKNYYQRLPHVIVSEPPPWYQTKFNLQDREQKRHDATIAAIRAQLEAAEKGGCTPETALKAIAQILKDEVKL